jgi:hypothetical protein
VIFSSIITWDIALLQWGLFNIIHSLHGPLSALQFTIDQNVATFMFEWEYRIY